MAKRTALEQHVSNERKSDLNDWTEEGVQAADALARAVAGTEDSQDALDAFETAIAYADGKAAPAWLPQAGEWITGTVIGIKRVQTAAMKAPAPVIELRQDRTAALVSVWATGTVLQNELASQGVVAGDRIGIRYLGKMIGEGGQEYHQHVLRVAPRERAQ
jgi:hypothetical protein